MMWYTNLWLRVATFWMLLLFLLAIGRGFTSCNPEDTVHANPAGHIKYGTFKARSSQLRYTIGIYFGYSKHMDNDGEWWSISGSFMDNQWFLGLWIINGFWVSSSSGGYPFIARWLISYPIGSMYGIYGNIYHQYTPNVSIYTIHGSYGYSYPMTKWMMIWRHPHMT